MSLLRRRRAYPSIALTDISITMPAARQSPSGLVVVPEPDQRPSFRGGARAVERAVNEVRHALVKIVPRVQTRLANAAVVN